MSLYTEPHFGIEDFEISLISGTMSIICAVRTHTFVWHATNRQDYLQAAVLHLNIEWWGWNSFPMVLSITLQDVWTHERLRITYNARFYFTSLQRKPPVDKITP